MCRLERENCFAETKIVELYKGECLKSEEDEIEEDRRWVIDYLMTVLNNKWRKKNENITWHKGFDKGGQKPQKIKLSKRQVGIRKRLKLSY